MRASTGLFLVFIFVCLFSFSIIGVTNELTQVQSIGTLLDQKLTNEDFSLSLNSYMYDGNDQLLSDIYSTENRIYVSFSDIPSSFIEAFIATEDRHFFSHKGFDMTGIARALFVNAESQVVEQGGSTITQQLVKNIYLSHERTYNRKLTEVLYAFQLEKMFTKEQLLEFYLNTIYFQNGVYGIEAASHYYFSRSAQELTLAEVAFLSAIPNNPTYYNPLVYPENTKLRKEWILTRMAQMGFISEIQYEAAREEAITLNVRQKMDRYPDYVTYIYHEFEQLVGEKEGFTQKIKEAITEAEKSKIINEHKLRVDELLKSGIHIHTWLDPTKQEKTYKVIEAHLPNNDIQTSAVIIDHLSQAIVAISGGRDYQKFNFHRGYQAFRQPGSSMKPLLVYAPYLADQKSSIQSLINAAPFCKGGYCPQNFGGTIYGNVRLETAFKHSYNTAAVRMLDQIGIETAFSYFNQLGFSKISEADQRYPAALGGVTEGVSPLEMTNAYTVFANDGLFQKARGIKKVVDQKGNLLYEWNDPKVFVWDSETNSKMRHLLNKVVSEGTGRKASFPARYIGGKTGTTNSYHDLWFIGLNDRFTTGVWIGYDQPSSLQALSRQTPHLLIWRDIMKE